MNNNSSEGIDPHRIRALALDLDGTTLAPGAVLRDRTRRALGNCLDRGIQVIFCTGRSVASTEQFRRAAGAAGPMVCYNGAEVVDMPAGEILGAFLLKREIAEFCVDLARREGVYYQAYFPGEDGIGGETLRTDKEAEGAEIYRNHTGVQAVFGDLKDALDAPDFRGCIKGLFITEQEVMDRIRPEIEARFPGRVYLTQSSPTFLEVLAAGVSKGAGLRLVMEKLGLLPEEVIAIGDEENDLPMFSVAAHSAAPANAKAQVLKAAKTVIPSCDRDGVAVFLEGLFGV
jgi:Cof subfamily protein (haloacid dehalogenase superfamily)